VEIARRMGAKALELRAALSLYRSQDDDSARKDLASISGWFTEGLQMDDLKEARRLLVVRQKGSFG